MTDKARVLLWSTGSTNPYRLAVIWPGAYSCADVEGTPLPGTGPWTIRSQGVICTLSAPGGGGYTLEAVHTAAAGTPAPALQPPPTTAPATTVVSACAGAAYAATSWTGSFRIYARPGDPVLYTSSVTFSFGQPALLSGGCTVPVASATVGDAARTWRLDANAVDPPQQSLLSCSATACTAFHLIFGLGAGAPPQPINATALRMDVGFYSGQRNAMTATTMNGSAGSGKYGGSCCYDGDFDAARR